MYRIWKTEISQVNGSPESLGILIAIVREGDSISEIIFREFRRVDELLLEVLQELNPEVEDLNQIDVG